jgi:hypothetical protein
LTNPATAFGSQGPITAPTSNVATSNVATSTSSFGGSGGYSTGNNSIAFNLGGGLSDQSLASPAPSVYAPMGGGGAYTQNFAGATRGESQSQFTAQLQQGSQEYTQNYYNGTASGFLYNTLTALSQSWQQYTPFGWAGSGLAATGNTISGWGNAAARQGDSNAGTAAMFTSGLFNAASSILNPIGSAENLGAASADVGTMYGNAAGIGYGIGSLIGATQITQAITGENFATGQSLVGLDRWGMAFQGISAASGTAALGAGTWNAAMAAENTANTVGALEDWSNVNFEARMAARDNAWETDNAINIHGNSASSPRTAYLYGLYDKASNQLLKWGITQNPATRYSRAFMQNNYLDVINSGSRSDMLQLERNLVETNPGPLNFEPWAGSQAGGQP